MPDVLDQRTPGSWERKNIGLAGVHGFAVCRYGNRTRTHNPEGTGFLTVARTRESCPRYLKKRPYARPFSTVGIGSIVVSLGIARQFSAIHKIEKSESYEWTPFVLSRESLRIPSPVQFDSFQIVSYNAFDRRPRRSRNRMHGKATMRKAST